MTQQEKLHEAIAVLRSFTNELDAGTLKDVPISRYKNMLTVAIKSIVLLGALSETIIAERDLLVHVEKYQSIIDLRARYSEGIYIKRVVANISRLVAEIGEMLTGTLDDIIALDTKENDGKEMGKL